MEPKRLLVHLWRTDSFVRTSSSVRQSNSRNSSKSFPRFVKDFLKKLFIFLKKFCQVFRALFNRQMPFFPTQRRRDTTVQALSAMRVAFLETGGFVAFWGWRSELCHDSLPLLFLIRLVHIHLPRKYERKNRFRRRFIFLYFFGRRSFFLFLFFTFLYFTLLYFSLL